MIFLAVSQTTRMRTLEMWFKRDDKEKRSQWVTNIDKIRSAIDQRYKNGTLKVNITALVF